MALTGDFCARASAEGRPVTTLGLAEKRFLLWTAAEELLASVLGSLPSLHNSRIN